MFMDGLSFVAELQSPRSTSGLDPFSYALPEAISPSTPAPQQRATDAPPARLHATPFSAPSVYYLLFLPFDCRLTSFSLSLFFSRSPPLSQFF
jgi:hypothetical protein